MVLSFCEAGLVFILYLAETRFLYWFHLWRPLHPRTANLSKDEFDVFCYLVWGIWGARNKYIFENKHVSAIALIEDASSMLGAFQSCSLKIQKFPNIWEGDKRWVPPRLGLLNLNSDAAFCQFTARAGMDVLFAVILARWLLSRVGDMRGPCLPSTQRSRP